MPKGTEDHVGFFVPQSKHTYDDLAWAQTSVVVTGPCFVRRLRFQFLENLLRLGFGSGVHGGVSSVIIYFGTL